MADGEAVVELDGLTVTPQEPKAARKSPEDIERERHAAALEAERLFNRTNFGEE